MEERSIPYKFYISTWERSGSCISFLIRHSFEVTYLKLLILMKKYNTDYNVRAQFTDAYESVSLIIDIKLFHKRCMFDLLCGYKDGNIQTTSECLYV